MSYVGSNQFENTRQSSLELYLACFCSVEAGWQMLSSREQCRCGGSYRRHVRHHDYRGGLYRVIQ